VKLWGGEKKSGRGGLTMKSIGFLAEEGGMEGRQTFTGADCWGEKGEDPRNCATKALGRKKKGLHVPQR